MCAETLSSPLSATSPRGKCRAIKKVYSGRGLFDDLFPNGPIYKSADRPANFIEFTTEYIGYRFISLYRLQCFQLNYHSGEIFYVSPAGQ